MRDTDALSTPAANSASHVSAVYVLMQLLVVILDAMLAGRRR